MATKSEDSPVHTENRKIAFSDLEFGKYTADHMLVSDYKDGSWLPAEIVGFSNLSLSPTMLGLHYGQLVFEGMKAFRMDNGDIAIFRIDKHYDRFCRSLERMCMPKVPKNIFKDGLIDLITNDIDWVPDIEGAALYIRPFMMATEERFGVKISDEYKFIIFSGPVGPYYSKPLRVKVENHFVRAAKGGTGYAKCAGNYGASFYPTAMARAAGFDQVLWTDGRENKYIEESGTMNVMFVINGVLVTPALSDSILDGVTRDSILKLTADLGMSYEERPVSVDELEEALQNGSLTEAFGAGTAAVVAPIQSIDVNGKEYLTPKVDDDSFMMRVRKELSDIRIGRKADKYNWLTVIKGH